MPSTERPESRCELTIRSLADLDRFAAALAASLPTTAVVTLEGDLGAGKTTLV